jgi:hypothetical protein
VSKLGDVKKNELYVCCEVRCSTIADNCVSVKQTRFMSESMKMGCAVSIQPQSDLCGLLSGV